MLKKSLKNDVQSSVPPCDLVITQITNNFDRLTKFLTSMYDSEAQLQ